MEHNEHKMVRNETNEYYNAGLGGMVLHFSVPSLKQSERGETRDGTRRTAGRTGRLRVGSGSVPSSPSVPPACRSGPVGSLSQQNGESNFRSFCLESVLI